MIAAPRAALALVVLAAVAGLAAAAREQPATLYDAVKNNPDLSSVFKKIVEVGLDKPFQNPKLGVTLFVPSNAAYARIVNSIGNNPALMNNATIIKQAMYYHIINKARRSKDFPRGEQPQFTSLTGSKVMVSTGPDSAFKVGGYNVLERDIKAGKSYLNIIDGFLIPPALIPTMLEATRAAAAKPAARRLSATEIPVAEWNKQQEAKAAAKKVKIAATEIPVAEWNKQQEAAAAAAAKPAARRLSATEIPVAEWNKQQEAKAAAKKVKIAATEIPVAEWNKQQEAKAAAKAAKHPKVTATEIPVAEWNKQQEAAAAQPASRRLSATEIPIEQWNQEQLAKAPNATAAPAKHAKAAPKTAAAQTKTGYETITTEVKEGTKVLKANGESVTKTYIVTKQAIPAPKVINEDKATVLPTLADEEDEKRGRVKKVKVAAVDAAAKPAARRLAEAAPAAANATAAKAPAAKAPAAKAPAAKHDKHAKAAPKTAAAQTKPPKVYYETISTDVDGPETADGATLGRRSNYNVTKVAIPTPKIFNEDKTTVVPELAEEEDEKTVQTLRLEKKAATKAAKAADKAALPAPKGRSLLKTGYETITTEVKEGTKVLKANGESVTRTYIVTKQAIPTPKVINEDKATVLPTLADEEDEKRGRVKKVKAAKTPKTAAAQMKVGVETISTDVEKELNSKGRLTGKIVAVTHKPLAAPQVVNEDKMTVVPTLADEDDEKPNSQLKAEAKARAKAAAQLHKTAAAMTKTGYETISTDAVAKEGADGQDVGRKVAVTQVPIAQYTKEHETKVKADKDPKEPKASKKQA